MTLQGDSVIVPTGEGHERSRAFVSGLRNRTLLVADRDHLHPLATSGNPTGFVRRIVRVDEGRLEARITTEPGELDEVFAHGDLVWHDDSAPILPRPTDSVAGPSEGAELRSAPPNGQATCRALGYTRPTLLTSNAGVTLTLTPRLEVEACHDETYRSGGGPCRGTCVPRWSPVLGALGLVLEATGFGSLHGVFSAPAVTCRPRPRPTTLALTPVACDATRAPGAGRRRVGRFHAQGTSRSRAVSSRRPTPWRRARRSCPRRTRAPKPSSARSFGVARSRSAVRRSRGPFAELATPHLPVAPPCARRRARIAGRSDPRLRRLVEGRSPSVLARRHAPRRRRHVGCEGTSAEATCAGKADGWWCDPSNRWRRCAARALRRQRCADGSCVADAQAARRDARRAVCR